MFHGGRHRHDLRRPAISHDAQPAVRPVSVSLPHRGGFFLGGLVLAVSQVPTLRQHASEDRIAWSIDYQAILVALLPCVLIVFYILASDYLGTAISLATMMFVLMLVRRTPVVLALGVSVVASLIIYFIFSRYLLIPLPEGLLSVGG
ncbi:tripartite tricarboxylate transporter TctB family protein [Modicisalibacter luteus]|uniref:tripartite tricarboxylate transporter TctB family protein n=1 Tax=Modicisalibacter luteus TaxID=453962 RepID=UPI00364113E9